MLVKNEKLFAGVESSYNAAVTLTGANALLVENLTWGFDSARFMDRPATRGSLAQLQAIFGGALKMVTFDIEIKGSGVAGTEPEHGILLEAAGFAKTIVASTSVSYKPSSDVANHKSLKFLYDQDGLIHSITGARCFAMSYTEGTDSYGKYSFSFAGHDGGLAESGALTPTYDATTPTPFINAGFTIGGYSGIISEYSFDMGLTLSRQKSANSSDGFGELLITARNVTGSVNPSAVKESVNSFIADYKSGKKMTIGTGTIGATGNSHKITLSESYFSDVSIGDEEGVRKYDTPFRCTDEGATDSEIEIFFA